MSTTKNDTLAGIEQGIHGIAATQKNHGGLLSTIAERQEEMGWTAPGGIDVPKCGS